MDSHIKECQQNNGQIKKYITLEKFPKPVVPQVTSNQTYRYLLAHNIESEYKTTQYYITFRYQTELQKTPGYQYPILIPTAVASTIKAKNHIRTISYDNSQQGFVEKWLEQAFSEALQICDDNILIEDIPQRYEVTIFRFDCLKSVTTSHSQFLLDQNSLSYLKLELYLIALHHDHPSTFVIPSLLYSRDRSGIMHQR
ncbi:MAG: hypothetical protein EZS28_001807 [Streblomastix strix]|uniref:Uncharacterized protein n=1 Tax=Streblomastix strix TaxID=222440 RepID=A0A5J4X622_9EUKA|nr:MAG: hypothetical protein EZS28_001807 [Streblomastix strix]